MRCVQPLGRVLTAALLVGPVAAQEATTLAWYLPDDIRYDAAFPTPASSLGWEVGTWHVRHDQLVQWFRTVAAASPRVQLETYGHTHEQRPLLLATVSSPENLARIEELRAQHVARVRSGALEDEGPAVVWMGYGVHGNESSASNSALLLAYHLAAAQGRAIEELLANTVVLIDPCVNPDGLSRFAHWANSHRGKNLVGDPNHRERSEAWPGGRTNHYWFDLNRDWLLQTHPESRGRLERFHAWLPCVLTDYHEMGGGSTYFFQPGIPSRQNPLTPERNLELTRRIAAYHAAALDELGSLYYTEESFDDFYYGKGSTYPDINGCVGILFEQASSRGHLQENSFGGISFPFTIKNQFTTSLSTLRAARELRGELTAFQREFYRSALAEAAKHPVRAYVFGAAEDPERAYRLADLLRRHAIDVYRLGRALEAGAAGEPGFEPGAAFVVPLAQPQFRLIRAVFETRTSWPDNTFYDVSSWTLPLSFDVPARAIALAEFESELVGEPWSDVAPPAGSLQRARAPVAWLFEWHHANAPRALHRLLAAGVRARVATRPLRCETATGPHDFDHGTIVVPTGIQDVEPDELLALMQRAAADGLDVFAATTGLTPEGVDLGSGSLRPLEEPRPLLVVGSGVSAYEAGEVWHHLDQRVDVAVSMVDKSALPGLDLARYTHVVLVSGAASGWTDDTLAKVRRWVSAGGVLVAVKSSAAWAAETLLANVPASDDPGSGPQDTPAEPPDAPPAYADYEELSAVQRVAGTIFEVRLDLTHPLCFGFVRERLPVFRNSEALLPEALDPFATPARYVAEPLLSGFASAENVARIAGSPAVRAQRMGAGCVVCFVDDPCFRGVWHGTSKFLANALFFGNAIKRTGPIERVDPAADDGHEHGQDEDGD
jgi:hypothetical protein